MPDISVIMPAYNVSRYPYYWVCRAVWSVLEQGAELCIGDDCSADNTCEILKAIDPGIKIARTDKNTGGAEACNVAARLATGRYLILLSCRSWYEPGSLIKMKNFLDKNPDIGFVYGVTRWHENRAGNSALKIPPEYQAEHFKKRFVSSFGYMYRREAWDAGYRYGCYIHIPEIDKTIAISDWHMAMNLIYRMNYQGHCLRDLVTLNYEIGGIPQQKDVTDRYKARITTEFKRLWADVL